MIDLLGFEHVHISEREGAHTGPCGRDDAKWEDCLWVAVIEFLRATGHPEIPATHAESEELRCASGDQPTGFSTWTDAQNGVKARYKLTLPPIIKGAAAIWAAFAPGTVAVVLGAGSPGNWQAGFTGGHAITGFRLDPVDALWACDGLAPVTYNGERLMKAALVAYINGQPNGGAIIGPIVGGDNMTVGFKPAAPFVGTFKIGVGHSLINMAQAGSPTRTDYPYKSWPGGLDVLNVIAAVNLTRYLDGAPIDIEGNSPPLNKRNEVYIVDLPGFGCDTYALRQDGVFTPAPDVTPFDQADLEAAKLAGRREE